LRHASIFILHPAFHLGEQRIDETSSRLHHRFKIGVLRVEIAEHVGVIDIRVGRIAKPSVTIFDGDAVMRDAVRYAPRDRDVRKIGWHRPWIGCGNVRSPYRPHPRSRDGMI